MKLLKVVVLVALMFLVGHAQERSDADATYALKGPVRTFRVEVATFVQPTEILRGTVLRVCDPHGYTLAEADPALASPYKKQIEARWVRVDQPIVEEDPNAFLEALRAQHEQLRKPL